MKAQRSKAFKPLGFVTMREGNVRFFALAMAALLMFGNNYSFDNPQALQKPIKEDVGLNNTQYNLLYSAFSIPNIFLTLAGGFMIDFLGSQKHFNQDPPKRSQSGHLRIQSRHPNSSERGRNRRLLRNLLDYVVRALPSRSRIRKPCHLIECHNEQMVSRQRIIHGIYNHL